MSALTSALESWLDTRMPDSRAYLIESHQYLCRRAARKFLRRGVDRADLEQVAAIGLIKAVDRYDRSYDTPFDAYAWRFVLGELMHYVRDSERVIRAPRRLRELDRRYGRAESELCLELGRSPMEAEVLQAMGGTSADSRELQMYRQGSAMVSLEAMRSFELAQVASYTMDTCVDALTIERGLGSLSVLEQEIIRHVYLRETPMAEIANILGYSRRHVSRLHNVAINKLLRVLRPSQSE